MSFIPGLRDQACDAYIKRVVALPGEIVSVNTKGELIINNKLIPEPYVSYKCSLSLFNQCGQFENIKVPKNHFLVLGDGKLIKRPFLIYEGKKVILGFNEIEYAKQFI